jgi:dimethylhistidine N-methyltransferase
MNPHPRYVCLAVPGSSGNMAEEVRAGLTAPQKWLPCKYFYDAQGQALFERICELPEYYLTRTETAILQNQARAIVDRCPAEVTLVELGSGSSRKTRFLIEPLLHRQHELVYHAIDLAPDALSLAAQGLVSEYPGLRFVGLASDFADGLNYLAAQGGPPRLFVFLGSTIGNFDEDQIDRFFSLIRNVLRPQDRFLLGFDLLKDPAILLPAYDDAEGVTAEFNRNLLVRLNKELQGDFDAASFDHQALFNAACSRIEMHLVSRKEQKAHIKALDLVIPFRKGETIHTENCYKHSEEDMMTLLADHDLHLAGSFMDPKRWFCLYLLCTFEPRRSA